MCVYVCVYVCIYDVCMYVRICMYVGIRMYVCVYLPTRQDLPRGLTKYLRNMFCNNKRN